ncbi:MAG: hypoxanthine phosphoribosyltransferase [Lachnospiraceae bacterium]|jgi:hypoxanthine phosphoribosyltransferase|nr:MAG: hypoxanthine phosphoribosyltransferase [Lachnospiraceae bacterium]
MNISNTLISQEEIETKVIELAKKIEMDYKNQEVLIVGVLKGAFVFVSDLVRNINLDLSLDFIAVSSYGMSTESSGVVKINKDIEMDLTGKNVIIVEDIIDTGLTLKYIKEYLSGKNAKSVRICTLLDKPSRRKCNVDVDYVGFEIEDLFIVGYGIDCKEKYRNLPYIAYVQE